MCLCVCVYICIYSIVVILDCVHLYVENYKLIKHKSKLTSIYIYIYIFFNFCSNSSKKKLTMMLAWGVGKENCMPFDKSKTVYNAPYNKTSEM